MGGILELAFLLIIIRKLEARSLHTLPSGPSPTATSDLLDHEPSSPSSSVDFRSETRIDAAFHREGGKARQGKARLQRADMAAPVARGE